MPILPKPIEPLHRLVALTRPLDRLVNVLSFLLGRPRTRILQVGSESFADLGVHLAEHGIATQVRRGELVAHLRASRYACDLFLVEFAEFMTGAPLDSQAQWLEFCLALVDEES